MITRFARGKAAVVATETVGGDGGVIHRGRGPGIGAVAAVTLGGGGDMVARFTRGSAAVMTTAAGTLHLGVVHGAHRRPRCRCRIMTGVAAVATGYVPGGFTRGNCTVVTTEAGTDHLGMIHRTRWQG